MNKKILIALLLFVSLISNSQVLPLDFSGKYEKSSPDAGGLISATSIITVSRDSDEVVSLFIKGENAYKKQNYSTAKEKLELFISARLPAGDTIESYSPNYEFVKPENKACSYLKQIYFMESNYIKALYYHNLEVNVFPERFVGCFHGATSHLYALNLFASKCYEGMMDYSNAIDIIIRHWGRSNFEERFADLLIKKTGREALQEEINKIIADSNIELNSNRFSVTLGGYVVPVYYYKYEYFGKEITELSEIELTGYKNKALKVFTSSIIYKLIMEN